MSGDPAYVRRLLDQAREEGQWYAGQPGAAAHCFEVLTLLPDHHEAAELIYELFCDEWLIYDNRNAIQQQIDEWDDRPWQQRRRLALSCRFMSRWEDRHDEFLPGARRSGPPDVADLLDEGKGLLLTAYCLGDEECTDLAWPCFVEAFRRTTDPRGTLLWVGRRYLDLGFFADAVEVLAELCSRFPGDSARYLLAEARWSRDNAHRIPWLPPPGDGSRYRRMMAFIDPDAPDYEEVIHELRAKMRERHADRPAWQPALAPDLAALVASALPPGEPFAGAAAPALVDWSFLDQDDGEPGDLPEWARKMTELFDGEISPDITRQFHWSRPIPPPTTPRRYDPDEPPFDPGEMFGSDDDDTLSDEEC